MKTKESPQRSPSGLSALFNVSAARRGRRQGSFVAKEDVRGDDATHHDLCDLSVYLSTLPHGSVKTF